MDTHTLYAVNIQTAEDVDLLIDQVSDQNIDTGIADMLVHADGGVDPQFVAVATQVPRISVTTSKLASLFGDIWVDGLKISSDVDDDGAEFFFQKVAKGGTRATGANHVKLTMNDGMAFLRSVTAGLESHASAEVEFVATWDETNDPLVIQTGQSLEGTPTTDEIFVVGPAYINGVQLESIQETNIDTATEEFLHGGDGDVWQKFIAIGRRAPIITLRTLDVVSLSTFGLSGTAQGSTDSDVYFRKVLKNGTRVPNATAQHIKVSMDDGNITCRAITGSDGEVLGTEVRLYPTWDLTNAILAVDTASVIP